MSKEEILETILDKMHNGDDEIVDVFSFIDWLENFIQEQMEE